MSSTSSRIAEAEQQIEQMQAVLAQAKRGLEPPTEPRPPPERQLSPRARPVSGSLSRLRSSSSPWC